MERSPAAGRSIALGLIAVTLAGVVFSVSQQGPARFLKEWRSLCAPSPSAPRVGDRVTLRWDAWDDEPWVVVYVPDAAAGILTVGLRRGEETTICTLWDLRPAGSW